MSTYEGEHTIFGLLGQANLILRTFFSVTNILIPKDEALLQSSASTTPSKKKKTQNPFPSVPFQMF
jgi:hypothetical protein